MGFYILIILTVLVFWWRLRSNFSTMSGSSWKYIRLFMIILTLVLVIAFMKILLMRDDIALPHNAFTLIFFGAIAAMLISAGVFYILFSFLHLGFRTVLKRGLKWMTWVNIVFTSIIILLFINGYFFGRFNIKTEKQDIFLKDCDQRLDGMKIAFISDLHLSSFENHYDKLSDVISEININRPDLVLNAGDFVTYGWQEFDRCDTILRKARARLGTFAVTGNHDDCSYDTYIDAGQQSDGSLLVDSLIRSSGYTILDDSCELVTFNGARVYVAGISTTGHHLNIRYGNDKEALEGVRDSSLVLFLVHDPAFWGINREISNIADITFSGHTHGMQIGLPTPWGLVSPASFVHKYIVGLYSSDGHYLYVNRGLGSMGMAVRIFMPPEITIITLHSEQAD